MANNFLQITITMNWKVHVNWISNEKERKLDERNRDQT